MKLLYAAPVWGQRYLRYYVDHALPTLLHASNLPALAAAHQLDVVLMTDGATVGMLHAETEHRFRFARSCHYRMVDTSHAVPGHAMIAAHNAGLCMAYEADAAYVMGHATNAWAPGNGARILRSLAAGRRAMLFPVFDARSMPGASAAEHAAAVAARYAGLAPGPFYNARRTIGAGVMWVAAGAAPGTHALLFRTPHPNVEWVWQERPAQIAHSPDDDLVAKAVEAIDVVDVAHPAEYADYDVAEVADGAPPEPGREMLPAWPGLLAAWWHQWQRPWKNVWLGTNFWFGEPELTAKAAMEAAADKFVAEALQQ